MEGFQVSAEHLVLLAKEHELTCARVDRIFLGRNAVMRKALGATVEDECRLGVHKVANVRSLFSLLAA